MTSFGSQGRIKNEPLVDVDKMIRAVLYGRVTLKSKFSFTFNLLQFPNQE